jgi:hypothetical protein
MTSHSKSQIQTLLSNPSYVDQALRILGDNQTPSELRSKSTHINNDIGFSAAYGTTGTRLFEFVTGINTKTGEKKWQPKSLANPIADRVFGRYIRNHGLANALELGRKIALIHWKQLGALINWQPVAIPAAPVQTKRKEDGTLDKVIVRGLEFQVHKGKAIRFLHDSKRVWLPVSQIDIDAATGEVEMPRWLARNKGLL